MTGSEIARYRLAQQHIAQPKHVEPGQVVAWLGAMQAQDFTGAKWAIGLRTTGATEADVDQAIAKRSIVRTWPMRGTLHFVAAPDVRWMLKLLTPRIIAGTATRMKRLELNDKILGRCKDLFIEVLQGGKQMAREDVYQVLAKARISSEGMRGYHILWRLAQEGLICFGARDEGQHTFALLEEWIPVAKTWEREEALAELARRYFTSHGPATVADFVWWSGLKVSDAKIGVQLAGASLQHRKIEGTDYWMAAELPKLKQGVPRVDLLPGFDEFLLGYKDRSAVLDARHARKICPGANGIFMSTVVLDGRVEGTWKRTTKKGGVVVTPTAFGKFTEAQKKGMAAAAKSYGRFLVIPATLV